MWVYNFLVFLRYTQNYHYYKQVLVIQAQKIKQHFIITYEEPPLGGSSNIHHNRQCK